MADDQMDKPTETKTEIKKSGYGSRPMWRWILLYVIVGAVLYVAAYYFFFRGKATAPGSIY